VWRRRLRPVGVAFYDITAGNNSWDTFGVTGYSAVPAGILTRAWARPTPTT